MPKKKQSPTVVAPEADAPLSAAEEFNRLIEVSGEIPPCLICGEEITGDYYVIQDLNTEEYSCLCWPCNEAWDDMEREAAVNAKPKNSKRK